MNETEQLKLEFQQIKDSLLHLLNKMDELLTYVSELHVNTIEGFQILEKRIDNLESHL